LVALLAFGVGASVVGSAVSSGAAVEACARGSAVGCSLAESAVAVGVDFFDGSFFLVSDFF
jgi:hypothetical protein